MAIQRVFANYMYNNMMFHPLNTTLDFDTLEDKINFLAIIENDMNFSYWNVGKMRKILTISKERTSTTLYNSRLPVWSKW